MIEIGIDTGGTCTDAVVYDTDNRKILAFGKALTTKSNLEVGIEQVLRRLPEDLLRQAKSLSLSTTLATNACVENKGSRAKLLIIGADPDLIARLNQAMKDYGISDMSQLVVYDAKAENMFSEPFDPDWEDLKLRAPQLFEDCDCIGIAQTFPGANGGRFELTALRILKEHLSIPMTIACDISNETDFLKICASTLLNARLIPLITDFIRAVHNVMERLHLDIPLMIVRSDGTLMSEEMAKTCPVETLLCGPAASIIGGSELAGVDDALVLDMGGTTTDIAMVRHGLPVKASNGIMIGPYRTGIKGVDAEAISLGGDTAVRFNERGLYLDTERIIPVSILASRYKNVVSALKKLEIRTHPHTRMIHEFFVLQKDISQKAGYTDEERLMCSVLKDGPLITMDFVKALNADLYHLHTKRLEQEGVIIRSGLTPTDMMILKGDLDLYDPSAAQVLLNYAAMSLRLEPSHIPDMIYEMVARRMYQSLASFILRHQFPAMTKTLSGEQLQKILDVCYEQAVNNKPPALNEDANMSRADAQNEDANTSSADLFSANADQSLIAQLGLSTSLPLIGIGAPVHVFLPRVAQLLHTKAIVSEYAPVANALGAAAGHRTASFDIKISIEYEGFTIKEYSVIADCKRHTFEEKEDAIAFARSIATGMILKRAYFQGVGEDPQVDISIEEKCINKTILVEIIVHAVARAAKIS